MDLRDVQKARWAAFERRFGIIAVFVIGNLCGVMDSNDRGDRKWSCSCIHKTWMVGLSYAVHYMIGYDYFFGKPYSLSLL